LVAAVGINDACPVDVLGPNGLAQQNVIAGARRVVKIDHSRYGIVSIVV